MHSPDQSHSIGPDSMPDSLNERLYPSSGLQPRQGVDIGVALKPTAVWPFEELEGKVVPGMRR